jgi:hypothetical protein
LDERQKEEQDWSSFSETDEGEEEKRRREKQPSPSPSPLNKNSSNLTNSHATTSQQEGDKDKDISRPAIVQVEHFEEEPSKSEPGQSSNEKKSVNVDVQFDAKTWKKWREDSTRNEIGWRCRWIERRIKLLESEERRYEKRLESMKEKDQAKAKGPNPNQDARKNENGMAEEASLKANNQALVGSAGEKASTSTRCSPIAKAAKRPAKIKRRKLNKRKRDFKTEESLAGWLNVFSHLGNAADSSSSQKRELLHESAESDSEESENLLVDVMEEALLMHKQIHSLHAQIAYARQHINRQGKIVHRSAVPPVIDTQIFKTRIGAQLVAFEHERTMNQHAANGLLNSPGGSGYFAHGSSFDMDNVVSPMGASKIAPPLKVEFINTPRVREVELIRTTPEKGHSPEAKDGVKVKKEEGGGGTKAPVEEENGESSDDETEDTSDEAYERLHNPLEVAERKRFVAPVPGSNNKNPLDVQQQAAVNSQMNHTEARSRRPTVRNM